MAYGGFPYGGVGYAGSDVAEIPSADTRTALSVEVAFTTGALETPVWEDITADVRFWDVSRGRYRELERFQPGRATVILGNLSRQYDSVYADGPHFGDIRPMRRIRIRETFNGVTYPVFDGFVDRWDLDYPAVGKDATATVTATDMFKILARTDLPVSVYDDVVLADEPDVYWRLDEQKSSAGDDDLLALNHGTLAAAANGTYLGPPQLGGEPLIVNDPGSSMGIVSDDAAPGTGDMGVSTAAADFSLIPTTTTAWVVELWCVPTQDPGVNGTLFCQRAAGGSVDVHVYYNASNVFVCNVFSDATDQSVTTSPTTFPTHARYHVVVKVVPGESVKMWVNGTLFDDADTFTEYDEAPGLLSFGTLGSSGGFNWDGPISHVAIWRGDAAEAFGATEVATHYAAGTAPWQDDQPDDRLGRILDEAEWFEDLREIDAGNVALQSAQLGTTALEHAQKVGETEYGGLLFVNRAGVVRFVSRETAFGRQPYPVTFGDGTGEVGYRSIRPDDGDEVIRNSATISRLNGVAQTATGTTVDEFGRFQYTLEGLLHRLDSYSVDYANFVVDEYDQPRRRITELTIGPVPDGDEDLYYPAMLGPELGDAIDVTHTPQSLGDPFEQTCVIEGIRHTSAPGRNRQVTFTLSPEYSFRALEDEDVATLGYAEVTTSQTGITTETDLTGLSVDVTVAANRYIKITFGGENSRTVADGRCRFSIKEGTTVLQVADVNVDVAADAVTVQKSVVLVSPSAGAHTYKVSLTRSNGSGTVGLVASATLPAFILVEDIGPA